MGNISIQNVNLILPLMTEESPPLRDGEGSPVLGACTYFLEHITTGSAIWLTEVFYLLSWVLSVLMPFTAYAFRSGKTLL